ncbi:TetR/AcrR family transcriptional regulator [Rhizobacter sp. Root1221]|uniref:TetR/AcrR family transcriptional regulator n=1 Tax=Rhizobacter sp. Root1221 TaxID=1736433 RepID=UPI0006F8F2C9|nr:TetR/AcrR family transcriptional regulator [Rhizobacter sp. Root1221]KQW01564.1 TetR family transcriptional regulator [Rhizobacter sp. Root1221]
MTAKASETPARGTYRHGDLRNALLQAGIALAREGGPEAIVLREATRRAGVVPNAAYRHFASRGDLVDAVRSAALSELACEMEAGVARATAGLDGADAARAALRAVGLGYLKFAREQQGLFLTTFPFPNDVRVDTDPARAGASGLNPFQLLGAALDRMVDTGLMAASRRPGAEFLAWSAVHGLALLIIDGPLRHVPTPFTGQLAQRLLDMVEQGL